MSNEGNLERKRLCDRLFDLRSPIALLSLADDEDSRELVLPILIDASGQ